MHKVFHKLQNLDVYPKVYEDFYSQTFTDDVHTSTQLLRLSSGVVKIIDFGLARIYQASLKPLSENGVVVTIWYRAPTLLLGAKHYTRAVDMWAIGCIFVELLTLKPLYQGAEVKAIPNPFQLDQLHKIFKVLGHPTLEKWPSLGHFPHQ